VQQHAIEALRRADERVVAVGSLESSGGLHTSVSRHEADSLLAGFGLTRWDLFYQGFSDSQALLKLSALGASPWRTAHSHDRFHGRVV
jgi:hypothetical protein